MSYLSSNEVYVNRDYKTPFPVAAPVVSTPDFNVDNLYSFSAGTITIHDNLLIAIGKSIAVNELLSNLSGLITIKDNVTIDTGKSLSSNTIFVDDIYSDVTTTVTLNNDTIVSSGKILSTDTIDSSSAPQITSHKSILPSITNTFSVGSNSLVWSNVYSTNLLGDTINSSSAPQITSQKSIFPSVTNTYSLGSNSLLWNDVYSTNIRANNFIPVTGNFSFTGHLLPSVDLTYDLGDLLLYRWRNSYVQDSYIFRLRSLIGAGIYVYDDFIPDGSYNLGTVLRPWTNMYATNLNLGTLKPFSPSTDITVTADFTPSGTLAIGSNFTPWDNIFSTTMSMNNLNSVNLGPISLKQSLIPDTNNTKDIGSSSNKLKDIYSTNITIANNLNLQAGGTPLNINEAVTNLSVTFTGPFSVNQTVNIRASRVGKSVTIFIPLVLATCNSTAAITTTANVLTGDWLPATAGGNDLRFPIDVQNNGTRGNGVMAIDSSGGITIYQRITVTSGDNSFSNTGSSGFRNTCVSYFANSTF